jgi:DNA-binding transcriptional LysR family regulator
MNTHHLELFYYVAKHGGISQAVRNIPYGIQQPAISHQIRSLEEDLGQILFQRRPFELTVAGKELFEFSRNFFDQLEPIATKLRGGPTQLLRIGASSIVLKDYLPTILKKLQKAHPHFRFNLYALNQPKIEALLQKQEIDMGITVLEPNQNSQIKQLKLIELTMGLLVLKDSPIKSTKVLFNKDLIQKPLIALPREDLLIRLFQQELLRREIDWPVEIEANALEVIETYVLNGFGIGLSVEIPGKVLDARLRFLKLPDFPKIKIGILWKHKLNSIAQELVNEAKLSVQKLGSLCSIK